MWASILKWMEANQVGDLTGVAGIGVSLIGFAFTVYGVFKSKAAAERAEEAARSARDSIHLFDSAVDFTSAIAILEEIKRAHRNKLWILLPDRYAAIRKLLISLRVSNSDLTDAQLTVVQNVLSNLSDIEKLVEKNLDNSGALNGAKFNAVLSSDVDNLVLLLAQLKAAKTGV